jgi:hypothetical protein
MLDFSHLPKAARGNIQIFNRPCTVTNLQWETWHRPRGVSMLYMICIGSGGGGGTGFQAAAAAARGGGAGGGSAPPTHFLGAWGGGGGGGHR